MAPGDAELLTKNGWAVGFLLASLELCVLVMTGFLWLTIRAYRRGDTAIGALFTVLWILVGGGWVLGVILGLLFGWIWVRRWQAGWFMCGWSLLIFLAAGNLALAIVMKKMSQEE